MIGRGWTKYASQSRTVHASIHTLLYMTPIRTQQIVAGIDVGGATKGFHAIALTGRQIASKFWSIDPGQIANWCVDLGASVIGVDAPIAWSVTGRARPAERALMRTGIWCFATPSEEMALNHPTNYYGWMRNGAALYRALSKHFKPYDGRNEDHRPIVFETFPHAITCSLEHKIVPATTKRKARRALLTKLAVACDDLTNIDFIDAALCALTADYFARQRYCKHGDPTEGYIVVPLGD